MTLRRISHEQWAIFLADVEKRFRGAPTTARVRDHHIEEHEQLIARDLPLSELRLRAESPEAVLLSVVQPSQAVKVTEILYPTVVSLIEEGAQDESGAGIALQVETAAAVYTVHIGVPAHEV